MELLLNAFIASQFSDAPVFWMFHYQKLKNHITRIHEIALRIVYEDYTMFDEHLGRDDSFRIHYCKLQKSLI